MGGTNRLARRLEKRRDGTGIVAGLREVFADLNLGELRRAEGRIPVAEIRSVLLSRSFTVEDCDWTDFCRKHAPDGFISESDLAWLINPLRKRPRDISTITLDSPLLAYYNSLFHDEQWIGFQSAEWEAFLQALQVPLPMTFRLHSTSLRTEVEEAVKVREPTSLLHSSISGPLPVYGCDDTVYQGSERLQEFCKAFHSGGLLSFQEFVSMLPVIALDIQPTDRVLDMCSAPGSKTVQVLDQVRANAPLCQDSLIVANEKDYVKASHTLPSRLKRYYTPNIVITRSDASAFPRLVVKGCDLKFDKVVCDVPCSGDGTLRKDRGLLNSWSEDYVSKLVPVQQSILRRGFQSLVPGGVLAYSTCSMNPREDEEAVLSLLNSTAEAELVNVNEVLASRQVRLRSKGGVRRRDDDSPLATLVAECVLRVFPHSDNTGGFFVALIRKKHDAGEPAPAVSKFSNWAGSKRLQLLPIGPDEDADSIGKFFGCALLSDAHAAGLRVAKHYSPTGKVNRLFLLSHSACTLVFDAQLHKSPGVEIISAGSRVFERLDDGFLADCPCRWRVATESAEWFASVVTTRKVLTSGIQKDLAILLLKSQSAARADFALSYPELVDMPSGPILLGFDVSGKVVWLPGTLHPSKVELTVDISYRKCLLFLLFGIETGFSDSKSISA